jgi:hypothetical protein
MSVSLAAIRLTEWEWKIQLLKQVTATHTNPLLYHARYPFEAIFANYMLPRPDATPPRIPQNIENLQLVCAVLPPFSILLKKIPPILCPQNPSYVTSTPTLQHSRSYRKSMRLAAFEGFISGTRKRWVF